MLLGIEKIHLQIPLSALEPSFWVLVPYVKVGIIQRPSLVSLYIVYGPWIDVSDLVVKHSNLMKCFGTDLAWILPYRLHLTLMMLLPALNCFPLSSFFVLSRCFTVCILSAQHKTVPTRMRTARRWQRQRWGPVASSLFLALFKLRALVPCILLLHPPHVHTLTSRKGDGKGAFAAPLTLNEIIQILLVLAPFLSFSLWTKGTMSESWKCWNGKGFSQGHEETASLASICSNQAGLRGGRK